MIICVSYPRALNSFPVRRKPGEENYLFCIHVFWAYRVHHGTHMEVREQSQMLVLAFLLVWDSVVSQGYTRLVGPWASYLHLPSSIFPQHWDYRHSCYVYPAFTWFLGIQTSVLLLMKWIHWAIAHTQHLELWILLHALGAYACLTTSSCNSLGE